jgi:vacuolar-type H+-ATPase subunit H
METLAAAEEQVRRMRADAAAAAKQSIAEARESGEQLIAEAIRKSAEEIGELARQSDEKAKAEALDLAGNNENRKAAMRAKAEAKAEQAVALIVERIVNS